MENNIQLFLENLSKNYQSLNEEQKKQISEFYISFHFNEKEREKDFSQKDLLKFLSLGWFVYENTN